jgi:hypothetical protein
MANQSKIEINQESFLKTLNLIQENLSEERNLALDRFKRQEEQIDSSEQFIMQGKILSDYLRLAQSSTESLFAIAKLQAGILYKNDAAANAGNALSHDDIQKAIQSALANGDIDNLSIDTK